MRLTYIPDDRYLAVNGVGVHRTPVIPNQPATLSAIQAYEDGTIEVEWTDAANTFGAADLPAGFLTLLASIHADYTADLVYVYQNPDGSAELAGTKSDVPDGAVYLAVEPGDIPQEPVETWDVDFSDPDGTGGVL